MERQAQLTDRVSGFMDGVFAALQQADSGIQRRISEGGDVSAAWLQNSYSSGSAALVQLAEDSLNIRFAEAEQAVTIETESDGITNDAGRKVISLSDHRDLNSFFGAVAEGVLSVTPVKRQDGTFLSPADLTAGRQPG